MTSVLLCAGGTGGHLFPAQALAQELTARGYDPHLATDARGRAYAGAFAEDHLHIVPSATFASKNPIALLKTARTLYAGYGRAKALLKRLDAAAAVGFGGYPSVPPVLAAQRMGLPTALHEQNAVLGRANRLLAKRADVIAAGFSSASLPKGTIITGNPLRTEIMEVAEQAEYTPSDGDAPFHLLVIGGSQGAQFFGEAVPEALGLLSEGLRKRLRVTLQAREEQVEVAQASLKADGIAGEVAPFFKGMGERLASAHLILCRAGASTVSEVAAIGIPSILVPYPFALDHDQAANAEELVSKGGGIIARQDTLNPSSLAAMIGSAMEEPERLTAQAAAARGVGKRDATARMADLVEKMIKGR